MKTRLRFACLSTLVLVSALVAASPATPSAPARRQDDVLPAAAVLVVSKGSKVYSAVAPGGLFRIQGALSTKFAGARIRLHRLDRGRLIPVTSARVKRSGSYTLESTAPSQTGNHRYVSSARAAKKRSTRRFTIRVVTSTPPTTDPPQTPTPAQPPPLPPPVGATAAAGDPNDWTPITSRPVRWDPCSVISWSVSGTPPYEGQQADLDVAFARLSQASGLQFVQVSDPAVSAIDITWSTPAETPSLAGNVAGLGGPSFVLRPDGTGKAVAGRVVLDSTESMVGGYSTSVSSWGKVMLHELTHVAGLGHADGREQIMYYAVTKTAEFGAGDLTGLHHVGAAQGCLPDVVSRGRTGSTAILTH